MLQLIETATWSQEVSPAPRPDPDGHFFGGRLSPQDVLLAELAGEPVGYVKLIPQFRRLSAGQHIYEIIGLAVAPARHVAGSDGS